MFERWQKWGKPPVAVQHFPTCLEFSDAFSQTGNNIYNIWPRVFAAVPHPDRFFVSPQGWSRPICAGKKPTSWPKKQWVTWSGYLGCCRSTEVSFACMQPCGQGFSLFLGLLAICLTTVWTGFVAICVSHLSSNALHLTLLRSAFACRLTEELFSHS